MSMKNPLSKSHTSSQSGFTLVETLIAIFILALTIGALLTLTAGGFFSIRYAKNDIVASNLLQESLEYIRNSRDTAAENSVVWSIWLQNYEQCVNPNGCTVNPYAASAVDVVSECTGTCPYMTYYNTAGLYGYNTVSNLFNTTGDTYTTSFVRTITFKDITTSTGDPQTLVTARMDWKNGTNAKHVTQSIVLAPWNMSQQ